MVKVTAGKAKPAASAAPSSSLQKVTRSSQAPTKQTRHVAVKGKGLYVPNIRVEEFTIPGVDDLNVPSDSPWDYVWGLYAAKGWGKSTLASYFGLDDEQELATLDAMQRPCFTLMTEPLRRGLVMRMREVPQASYADMKAGVYRDKYTPWEYCKGYLQACIDDDSVRVVSIDNFDTFCQHALNHWCKIEEVDNPTSKNDHGRMWSTIKTDVQSTLFEVKESGKGLVLTAHEKQVPIDDPIRGEYLTTQPALSDWPYNIWRQVTDFVLYGVFSSTGRSIFVRGNQFFHASCGVKDRFLGPDADGNLFPIASFNGGLSPEDTYGNFLKSFRNELEPEYWFNDLPALAEAAAKKKVKKKE